MAVWHQYFLNKWLTFIKAMTPLHGGATNRLKVRHIPMVLYLCEILT